MAPGRASNIPTKPKPVFTKFVLPASEVEVLGYCLSKRRISHATLFPGYDNAPVPATAEAFSAAAGPAGYYRKIKQSMRGAFFEK
jgi:hypothetical protein